MDDDQAPAGREDAGLLRREDVEAALAAVNAELAATVPALRVRLVLWDGEADGWEVRSVVVTVGFSTFSVSRDHGPAGFLADLADHVVEDACDELWGPWPLVAGRWLRAEVDADGIAVWRRGEVTVPIGTLRDAG